MFGVLVNIGSSSSNPNGRGRIFKDCTFEYLPIPEFGKTTERVPTYRDLGFDNVKFPDLPVHLDPEFQTFTYGHVKRGFGDIQSLLRLVESDVLFFYATLQNEERWSPYLIGFFRNLEVHDCRKLSTEQVLCFKSIGFSNNAHLKRVHPSVDLLIKGGEESKLLEWAFPLAEECNQLAPRKTLTDIIHTATGREILSGTPWFRWTLTSDRAEELLDRIESEQSIGC
jgi:hypothetical protein